MSIQLSVLGLYQYDPTILDADHFLLPAGVDRETLLPLILTESAELEVMYPNPQTLGAVIKAWSAARRPAWERIKAALEAEYNPIHNYDRTEEEEHESTDTDTDTGTVTRKKTGTVELEGSGADTFKRTGTEATAKTGTEATAKTGTEEYESEQTASGNSTNQVTGYNASTMADKDKTVTNDSGAGSGTTTHNTTDTTTHNTTDTITHNTTETSTKGSKDTQTHNTTDTETRNLSRGHSGEGNRTLHVFGNIGVTTAAQMISGELDIRQTDIYHIITREFVKYFCILVY